MRLGRVICAVVLLLSSFALSQTPAKDTTTDAKDVTTFRARSELVFVPVVVTRHGAHVGGLNKDAFKIEQDGKQQEISVFEEVTEATPATAGPIASSPDVVTNYAVADRQPKRVLIVVLDMVNTPFLNQKRAKDALIKFLATSVPKDEPIALFALGSSGLKQLHPFTTDTRVLAAALQKVTSRLSNSDSSTPTLEDTGLSGLDSLETQEAQRLYQWMSDAIATEDAFRQKGSIQLTLAAMQQIAGAFTGVPGRKAMLWASDGVPLLLAEPSSISGVSTEMQQDYENTWRLLNAANIAVYPIALDGLRADTFDASRANAPLVSRLNNQNSIRYNQRQQRLDAMRSFADNTGGRAFLNNNDIVHGFEEASRDSRSYYMLGYYLRGETKPGWHKLKVRAASPHSDVRAREGFYVGEKELDRRAMRREFIVALDSPADYTGVHFSAKVAPQSPVVNAKQSDKRDITVNLMIPIRSVNIADNKLDLDLAVIAFRQDGTAAGESAGAMHAKIQPDSMPKLLTTGLTIKAAVQVAAGEYELRVGIRDNTSGNIGTLRTRLVVQ